MTQEQFTDANITRRIIGAAIEPQPLCACRCARGASPAKHPSYPALKPKGRMRLVASPRARRGAHLAFQNLGKENRGDWRGLERATDAIGHLTSSIVVWLLKPGTISPHQSLPASR